MCALYGCACVASSTWFGTGAAAELHLALIASTLTRVLPPPYQVQLNSLNFALSHGPPRKRCPARWCPAGTRDTDHCCTVCRARLCSALSAHMILYKVYILMLSACRVYFGGGSSAKVLRSAANALEQRAPFPDGRRGAAAPPPSLQ